MKLLIHIISTVFLFTGAVYSQTQISRSVISSGSQDSNSGTIQLSSTIGEVAVATKNGNYVLTEGFQQAIVVNGLVTFTLNIRDASCQGQSNGFAELVNINGCDAPYEVLWSNGQSGNTVTNLPPGNYSVQVISDDDCQSQLHSFTIGLINDNPCVLKFYSGITPNNDGVNDVWEIDNVSLFPDNEVNIFDRRGNKVYSGKNYDNQDEVWKGENLSGNTLPSGTYFFIFESVEITQKGWIELTR